MLNPPTYKPMQNVPKAPPDAAPADTVAGVKKPTPHASDQVELSDRPVWVAEYGHGARKGKVIATDALSGKRKMHIRFDDGTHDRWCFAKSIFDNSQAAEEASR